jgi:hypothetical protein
MAGPSLATLEEQKNAVTGELNLALKAVTTPIVSLGAYTAGKRIPLLAHIRQLLRIDLSAIDLSAAEPFRQPLEHIRLLFLKGVLTYYRELAAKLDRLLQIKDPLQRKRIRDLVGTRDAIESVLEALEDKIEDLEIATSPEVHTAIKQLIDEAKSP